MPYKHRRQLSQQLWMGLQAYFCWASNVTTWHVKASLHWLCSQKAIIWSLFPVLLGYKTAFNQKPGIVTALILILWITYKAPFLNLSKVNVKVRSIFANFYFFSHTISIYDNSEELLARRWFLWVIFLQVETKLKEMQIYFPFFFFFLNCKDLTLQSLSSFVKFIGLLWKTTLWHPCHTHRVTGYFSFSSLVLKVLVKVHLSYVWQLLMFAYFFITSQQQYF